MSKLIYEKLMANNPSTLTNMVNSKNQKVLFVEHPFEGDEYPVIVVFPEHKVAFSSDFWDTDDMEEIGGDYEPLLIDGKLMYGYETY